MSVIQHSENIHVNSAIIQLNRIDCIFFNDGSTWRAEYLVRSVKSLRNASLHHTNNNSKRKQVGKIT